MVIFILHYWVEFLILLITHLDPAIPDLESEAQSAGFCKKIK
jgi:hypothetical protein